MDLTDSPYGMKNLNIISPLLVIVLALARPAVDAHDDDRVARFMTESALYMTKRA